MLTITITFEAPDSLIAKYAGNPSQFPLVHLYALGQALLDGSDPHGNRYRGESPPIDPVIVGEFPGVGLASLKWWWSGLKCPREQIRAFGAYLMAEAANQFLMVALAQRARQQQAERGRTQLVLPGQMFPMAGQKNPRMQ